MRHRRRKELGRGGEEERIPPRIGASRNAEEPRFEDDEPREVPRRRRRPEPLVTPGEPARHRRPERDRGAGDGRRGRQAPKKPRRRSDAARHPLVLVLNTLMLIVVMGMIGGIVALLIGRDIYHAPGPLPEQMAIIIDRGASVEAIATGLEERGVIANRLVFMAAAYGTGATRRLQAGEYIIPAGATMEEVLDHLVSGRVVQHSITFAEGLTSAQIVKKMEENEILTGRIEAIPPEGSLLPETYRFTRGMTRQRLIEIMREARDEAVTEIWQARDPDLPLASPEQLVTLASIVEKETGQADERERVAGVFVNRLNRRMRLQSDPTILYGLHGGDAWSRPRTIFQSDLDRPNPYNTYQINGLPPGPIANPGRAALKASANPAETDALFFVADGTGGHVFAATYEEHQRNVARWREIERQRNAAQPVQ